MKRAVLSIIILLLCIISIAQVPEVFKYQVVARNGETPIPTTLPVRIPIQSGSIGSTVY